MRRALLLLMLLPCPAHAGAWARDLGGVYLRVGPSLFLGDEAPVFTDVEDSPEVRFEGRALELYAEAGLGVGLELDLSARWADHRNTTTDGETRRDAGLGDLELLLKWAPLNRGTAIALLGGVRLAPYDTVSAEEQLEGVPPLGPGGADVLTGLAIGHSFWPHAIWLNADLLHRLRLGGSSSGLRARVESGWRPWAPLAVAAEVAWQPAFGRTLDQPAGAPNVVADVFMLTGKLLAEVAWGAGLALDASWLPALGNDGPGWRLSAGVTWTR